MYVSEVRKLIQKKVDFNVQNIFYVTRSIDGEDIYGVCGNNNQIKGIALVYEENAGTVVIDVIS